MAYTFLLLVSLIAASVALPVDQVVKYDDNLNWRIVGGQNAPNGSFPYIVSLRGWTGSHSCGGVIISNYFVLTAAHCTFGADPQLLQIVAGSTTLNSGGTAYRIQSILNHPNYTASTLQNDIAILRLTQPLYYGTTVAPVTISAREVGGGEAAVLSGWGTTTNGGAVPNNLQYINLVTLNVADCQGRLSPNPVTESQICTLTVTGQGACHGDSGGPLVVANEVVGLVSWGIPCGNGLPDVYARVFSYRDWIRENTDL